jgi:integrase
VDASSDQFKLGELMRNIDMTEDLRRLIVFMVNSYIRPTDIKFMQHKHVDVVRNRNVFLRLRLPPTKGHSDPITTMPKAVDTYHTLLQYHLAQGLIGTDHSEDYVFLPQYKNNRDYALKQLQRQWEVLMHETGLATSPAGEERTLYSLRHTCIMWRLMLGEGVNTLALARNARTGVDMIDRFYAKPLSGEMNIEMLQSRRRKRRIYDGDAELFANDAVYK